MMDSLCEDVVSNRSYKSRGPVVDQGRVAKVPVDGNNGSQHYSYWNEAEKSGVKVASRL